MSRGGGICTHINYCSMSINAILHSYVKSCWHSEAIKVIKSKHGSLHAYCADAADGKPTWYPASCPMIVKHLKLQPLCREFQSFDDWTAEMKKAPISSLPFPLNKILGLKIVWICINSEGNPSSLSLQEWKSFIKLLTDLDNDDKRFSSINLLGSVQKRNVKGKKGVLVAAAGDKAKKKSLVIKKAVKKVKDDDIDGNNDGNDINDGNNGGGNDGNDGNDDETSTHSLTYSTYDSSYDSSGQSIRDSVTDESDYESEYDSEFSSSSGRSSTSASDSSDFSRATGSYSNSSSSSDNEE